MHGVRISGVSRSAICADTTEDEYTTKMEEEDLLNCQSPIVRVNVGGHVFETTERTMYKVKGSRLGRLSKDSRYWREDRQEYFFDRDPTIFRSILAYHRSGELHLPLDVCGPHLENELRFWGISDKHIDKCCWIHYIRLKGQKASLLEFERFFAWHEPDYKQVEVSSGSEGHLKFRMQAAYQSFRRRGWLFFHRPQSSRWAMAYAILSSVFVVLSIFSLVCGTTEYFTETRVVNHSSLLPASSKNISSSNASTLINEATDNLMTEMTEIWIGLEIIDFICVIFFTVDILLQLICSPDRIAYLRNPMSITELLAIFPYYCDFVGHLLNVMHKPRLKSLLDGVHVMRLFGVMRIFKLLKHQTGIQVLFYTMKTSFRELILMLTFVTVAMLIFSSLIYFLDDRQVFKSIPLSFWWSIVTLTTVGYGDYFPRTAGGYITGSVCALTGVLVVAFTVPILVNSFMLFYSHAHSMNIHKETVIKPNTRLRSLLSKAGVQRQGNGAMLASLLPKKEKSEIHSRRTTSNASVEDRVTKNIV